MLLHIWILYMIIWILYMMLVWFLCCSGEVSDAQYMIMMCYISFQIVMWWYTSVNDDIVPPYRVFIIEMWFLCFEWGCYRSWEIYIGVLCEVVVGSWLVLCLSQIEYWTVTNEWCSDTWEWYCMLYVMMILCIIIGVWCGLCDDV